MIKRMTSVALWLLLISGAVVLALIISVPVQRKIHAQADLAKPYTIRYEALATSASGDATPYAFLVAGRPNGDSMSQDSSPNSPRILKLLASGLLIAVAPVGNDIMTMGDGKPIALQRFGNNCEGYAGHTGETKTLLDFRTVKVISTGLQQSSNNHLLQTQESWLAPDLNCQHLEQKTSWTLNGKPNGVTTETAIWASAGEPDPALFKVPENSIEVPPSVFYPTLGCPFEPRMEAMYYKRKAERATAAQ